jgi:HD-GYP domain-containing protein (c-di-GMP phosphodiesterase class II)
MLHDIGKVGINDAILRKPGKLTKEEWLEMRKHPEIGFRIAQNNVDLAPISEYILSHHERWDGKGYPRGLHGEEIPVLSRILAVVDAFDAMTNERIYSKPRSAETAAEEILRCAGTQFDPIIAQIFVEQVLGM